MEQLFNLTDNHSDGTEANGTNVSSDSNGADAPLPQSSGISPDFITGMTAAYAVMIVLALLGNSFGLYVVLKKSSFINVTNLFIANMAVGDLLLTCTVMPFSIAFFYRNNRWIGGTLGNVTCKAVFYVIPIAIASTVFTMMLISFDRFYAILYPLKEKIFRKPKILSASIWVLSIVLMTPYLLMFQVTYVPTNDTYECMQVWPWADANHSLEDTYSVLTKFHIVVFVVVYALPLLIMIVIYFLICRKLWLRKIPGNVTDRNRAAAEKSKRKVVRLLVIICVVFAVCWFPVYVNHYFWYVRPDKVHLLPVEVQFIFAWIAHANSAINPCLYILLNSEYRRKLFAVMLCRSDVVPRPLQPQPVPLVIRGRPPQLEQHNCQHVEGPVIEIHVIEQPG